MNKKDRIHDWRKLKWPFTATFLYYSLLSLYTGTAEQSEQAPLREMFSKGAISLESRFILIYAQSSLSLLFNSGYASSSFLKKSW